MLNSKNFSNQLPLLTLEDHLFINSIYQNAVGCVHLYTGKNKKGIYPYVSTFTSSNQQDVIQNKLLINQNMKMSISTFLEKGNSLKANLNTVCALSVVLKGIEGYEATFIYQAFHELCSINKKEYLIPTFALLSDEVHLVYCFEMPVCLNIKDARKKEHTIWWLNTLTEKLCEEIKKLATYFNTFPVKINAGIPVPGTQYIKYDSYYDIESGQNKYEVVARGIITGITPENSKRFNIREFSDYLLGSLSEKRKKQEEFIKTHPKYANSKFHIGKGHFMTLKKINLNRSEFLKNIRNINDSDERKEKLTFLFWNFLRQTEMEEEQIKIAAKEFYMPIKTTCGYHKMLELAEPKKKYKYTTKELLNTLKISKEEAKEKGLYISDQKEYDRQYSRLYRKAVKEDMIKKGLTKKQKMKKAIKLAEKLRNAGMKLVQIAQKLEVSISTVKNYLSAAMSVTVAA